jgi:hypothetical protein
VGLSNARARLRHLHGDAASLQLRTEPGRFIAEVRIPVAGETGS